MSAPHAADIREQVWRSHYRLCERDRCEPSLDHTWQRVARAVAGAERPGTRRQWSRRFYELFSSGVFLPGGRIIAGAGTKRRATLFNCFVMGAIGDSVRGIFKALGETAVTLQHGGGVGCDFSTLRPCGSLAAGTGSTASGPVSFMTLWDSACETLLAGNRRRGAMMATLRCDHPDIEAFIDAKRAAGALRNFNLSVLITDSFMQAVRDDGGWPLCFGGGTAAPARSVRARELWDRITRAAFECAEPGVLFIDRINACNNLWWRERISATNPCGELPLPPYGACDLGSLDLTAFVHDPFTPSARLDRDALAQAAALATRVLDDVIDVSTFPLRAQARQARGSRRIGLGLTGLADALLMLGLRYGSTSACRIAAESMAIICEAAYATSVELARQRGVFPFYVAAPYLEAPFVAALPTHLRRDIARHGIRNSHLTAIAPAGTISLLAGGVSSGIEPIFARRYRRAVRDASGQTRTVVLADPALAGWHARGHRDPPAAFVDRANVSPAQQLAMQAAMQPHVDSAISKTVTVPRGTTFDAFRDTYANAYRLGLKGCTAYREGSLRGAVLSADASTDPQGAHCCSLVREGG